MFSCSGFLGLAEGGAEGGTEGGTEARVFRESEGAGGWAENPHLGKLGRDPVCEGNGDKCVSMEATGAAAGKQTEGEVANIASSSYRGEHSEAQAALEHQAGSLSFRTGLETCRLSQSWRVSVCLPLRPQTCG